MNIINLPKADSLRHARTLRAVLTALLALMVVSVSSLAQQTVILTRLTPHLYTAANYSGVHTNGVSVTTRNDLNPVTLGVSGLPPGVSVMFSTNPIVPTLTNNLFVAVQMIFGITNVATGDYPLEVTASGTGFTTETQSVTLHVGSLSIWAGPDTNSVAWSTAANWSPAPPVNGSNVKFQDEGVFTNYVDSSLTLASLAYVPFGNGLVRETVIAPGATLLVTNRFIANQESDGSSRNYTMTLVGSNGASLVVNTPNTTAALESFNGGNSGVRYDFSRLDNFMVTASRFGMGDVTLVTEGSYGVQGLNQFFLARTNVIRALYSSAITGDHFTNSIQIWNNDQAFNNGGNFTGNLGISNAFLADSVVFGKNRVAGSSTVMRFNAAFLTNSPVAYFRNANGGRMSFFGLAVDSGTNAVSSGSGAQLDLTGGRLDMQVDTLWLARNRLNSSTNAGARFRGYLTYSGGTLDVNTARVGYKQNITDGRCEGRLILQGPGTLIVNDLLELGHYAGHLQNPLTDNANGPNGYGQLTVTSNGVARINRVTVGNGSGVTAGDPNRITLHTGGHLILSNTIAGPTASDPKLGNLTMGSVNSGGKLTLHISGTNTLIFVTNLAAGPFQNVINIASVANIDAYPVTIPIIAYDASSAQNFTLGTTPSGIIGGVVNNATTKTIDLTLSTNTPKTLVWVGNAGAAWDTTATNWVTQVGATPSRFADGDFVVFDDTATGPTEILVAADVIPGQSVGTPGILVSNNTLNYKFTAGGGTIRGTATTKKAGAGTFTMDASSENSFVVSEGTLLGAGTISSTVVEPGAKLEFAGSISGGLTSDGLVTLLSSGSLVGPLAIHGGALTNLGTITSTINLSQDIYVTNGGTINVTVPWSLPTNSVLVNNGVISQSGASGGNGGLTVNGGTLSGVGKITLASGSTSDARVTLGAGGHLIIGNSPNEITNMIIATRLDFNSGSTTTFDVNTSVGADQILLTDGFLQGKVNYGQNASLGGTFVVNRIGGPPFDSNTMLHFFDLTSNAPDNSNQALPGVIPAPAPGLVWDVSQMLTNLTLLVTGPPAVTNVLSGTNLVFSWPENRRGWRLERQTNSLSVGIEIDSTNWVTVAGSYGGTNLFYDTNDLSIFYFRSVQPINTNTPAAFYRLAYP